ncbi:amino acid ABC transporter permease [Neorhizobium sp. NCHU2750]|uniref:amino acid ABC transporter permease n=1 Tax=Neorhizobium sp. NCHU2750 TaxID=1825976 RepID=UPI000E76BE4D|nr:amino acid ABC transporter permease [Neorhizobium sp. NCHU2750]
MIDFLSPIFENYADWVPRLTSAARLTIFVTLVAYTLAFLGGLAIQFARFSRLTLLAISAKIYIVVIRGLPILVILYLIYFALPQAGITLDALTAGTLGLGLVYAAYLAEIFRAGFAAIPAGQREAALALGLTSFQAFRLVLMPQVLRLVLVPLLVSLISLLKDSSICALIAIPELTLTSRAIMSESFLPLQVFAFTALIYFCIAFPASRAVGMIAQRLRTPKIRSSHKRSALITSSYIRTDVSSSSDVPRNQED